MGPTPGLWARCNRPGSVRNHLHDLAAGDGGRCSHRCHCSAAAPTRHRHEVCNETSHRVLMCGRTKDRSYSAVPKSAVARISRDPASNFCSTELAPCRREYTRIYRAIRTRTETRLSRRHSVRPVKLLRSLVSWRSRFRVNFPSFAAIDV